MKQCANCPWKKSSNLTQIKGYCATKHKELKDTIAQPGSLEDTGHVMACHHSNGVDDMYCIGWLAHQLGPGNNIPLRIKMLNYDLSKVTTVGCQHENFENTLREVKK